MNITAEQNKGRISKKREAYSHRIQEQLREDRRVEASKRDEEYSGLTLEEKLERIAARPGDSKKEVFRLTGREETATEALRLIRGEGSFDLDRGIANAEARVATIKAKSKIC